MRRMSFALTTEQIKEKTKTVTRRLGWKNLRNGDYIQPVIKCMGLKKGEKQRLIGNPIKVISVSFERLDTITKWEVIQEGFPNLEPAEFVAMFCEANRCKPSKKITRIEFEYTSI